MRENTVVFLHGAGMGAWVWERIMPLIKTKTLALDLPSRLPSATPESCALSIVSALNDRSINSVILVMHSLAGVLAGDLGLLLDKRLTACIYVSAVIPVKGSSFVKAIGLPGRFLLPFLFRRHPHGLTPSEAMIRKELCTDLGEEDTAMVVNRYEAEFPGLYLSKSKGPPVCPSIYIKLTKDKSVLPSLQSKMIIQLSNPRLSEIDSGHLVMLSRPDDLAAIVNNFVKSNSIDG